MFSDQDTNNQISSMVFKKRPTSNMGMAKSDYNILNSIDTSHNSLRQASISVKHEDNRIPSNNARGMAHTEPDSLSPLYSKFTRSLQANVPNPKQSSRDVKESCQATNKIFLRHKTTLIGHSNTVD